METMREGYFGRFGGGFVPETLMDPVRELSLAYKKYIDDEDFQSELTRILENYVGRPTPLTFASRLSEYLGGAKIYFKREDLLHTGSHKINNAIGQVLLAQKMGKKRIVAETGAGQHGVATATAAALFGIDSVVYMGEEDIERQLQNVKRMKLLGAQVVPVNSGSRTLKDAINEAMRDWVTNISSTYYLLGSVLGPHPYPTMVRDFHKVIGIEAKRQFFDVEGRLPTKLIACVGGGSNAIGLFYDFINNESVTLCGVEAGGKGDDQDHAARFKYGSDGIFHGTFTKLLQSPSGQISKTHSISAGLDYPGVGAEHAMLEEQGRAIYTSVTDNEALEAFKLCSRLEGIIPALESSHALAQVIKDAPVMSKDETIIMNMSGRGDKDVDRIVT